MPAYLTPGVWFEAVDAGTPRIDPLRTDIAAFIGVAERGPRDLPRRIESQEQFRSEFGSLIENALLPFSVKAFFENDGRTCYVVRVAAPLAECDAAGAQPADRSSTNVTTTAGFVAGAVATIVQTVHTQTAGAQPADRASSVVAAVDGFPQGALVRIAQAAAPTTYRHIAATDAATQRIVWDRPLDAAYNLALPIDLAATHQVDRLIAAVAANSLSWTRPLDPFFLLNVVAAPMHIATNAAAATFDLLDDESRPTLRLAASSEGIWGNRLAVQVTRTSRIATSTGGAQPADRLSSLVESVVGFIPGTLARLFQPGLADAKYAIVRAVEPSENRLYWEGAIDPAFNLAPGHPIAIESVELALSVYDDGRLMETFEALSLVPANRAHYAPAVINGASQFIRVDDLHSVSPVPRNLPDPLSPSLDAGRATLRAGRDGIAALRVRDFTGDRGSDIRTGLRTLELVNDVSAIAAPDILIERIPPVEFIPTPKPVPDPCDPCAIVPPLVADPPPPKIEEQSATFTPAQVFAVQQAVVEHCQAMRDRIALIDPPNFPSTQIAEVESWRRRFDSSYAALYYPWIIVVDPLRRGPDLVRPLPPSGHVLGIYARSDRAVGVHKAPANEELSWAQDVTIDVGPELQGLLNPKGIDVIRPFAGRGLRVYGARTMSSAPQWRYVNVRRLFIMIERALSRSLQWAVFEPNDAHLREKVKLSISTFLGQLWRDGALAGATAEESYYVRCDDTNNTPAQAANGQFLAEVGIAPAIPAEFVVLRIGRVEDVLEVTENEGAPVWQ